MADEEYDVIVLGTGLKECILSGLLSVAKKKVLHMDRNDYYGADSASLNLQQMLRMDLENDEKEDANELAKGQADKLKATVGSAKQYSIDLCPKFIMANGDLVKMLLYTKVTRYLDFKCVDGSFVQATWLKNKPVHEVPVNAKMALASGIMGMFQKRRYKNFLVWVMGVDRNDPSTWSTLDLNNTTMEAVFSYWKCDENTVKFTGHAVALFNSDAYLKKKEQVWPCLDRIKLYAHSLARYEKSPYIYPVWGLGGLPEGFSRLAAVHGGTYMLRRPITKINYNDDGKVKSVNAMDGEEEKEFKLKEGGILLGDPTYFKDKHANKVKKVGQIARWILIGPANVRSPDGKTNLGLLSVTKNKTSGQIIIPSSPDKHKTDIYISVMSEALSIAPRGFAVASISARVFTDNPKAELAEAYGLFPKAGIKKEFFMVNDTYVPVNDPRADNTFICSSMDAQTHFEATTREVMGIYKLMTGKPVDLTAKPEDIEKEDE